MTNRKIDWQKIRKQIKIMPFIWLAFFLMGFITFYLRVDSHNKIRQNVLVNPSTAEGVVTNIYNNRGGHYAMFVFNINGQKYTGQTFYGYDGNIGDKICLTYNKANPEVNIYCNDSTIETFKEDVFLEALKLLGVVILGTVIFVPIVLFWQMITGNKKTISELTSRRK